MPRGSTNTTCVSCKAVIAVSTKTCKFCKTLQPRKQRLAKKLQKCEAKKDDWLKKQKNNKTNSHVLDEASVLVEKLNTLGYRAMVFLSKPGKKPSTWKTNVAHPRWHLSDQAAKCLHRMKALYEVLVDGWTNPQPSPSLDAEHSTSAPTTIPSPSPKAKPLTSAPTTIPSSSPEDRPSSSTYAVLLPTSPAIQPSTGPATPAAQTKRTAAAKKKQDVSPRKKLKKKNPQHFEECSHKIVGGEQYYPVKTVVKTKRQKGKQMQLVEWEPCSTCGKKWPLQWVEKDNTTTEEQQD
ncbi:hypothetical protein KUCAC02_004558 [Chaenocephalus aceratus]|uniref:Uncharacterized protein n=1 Tax=Chaenocephalus aceratus TaxID=36190 RepID=A0ACB9WYY9_CHAAC|nr:hypothetical protein KUCAC02_004558 [Chaenocephalus aceratus]